LGDLKK